MNPRGRRHREHRNANYLPKRTTSVTNTATTPKSMHTGPKKYLVNFMARSFPSREIQRRASVAKPPFGDFFLSRQKKPEGEETDADKQHHDRLSSHAPGVLFLGRRSMHAR
jgi:hypothetical protein